MAEDYFDRHSKAALIFGKYLPIIRPFSPLISGITKLRFPVFMSLTLAASVLYMSTYVLAGYFLGNQFPVIKDYLGWILPISIVLALIPVVREFRKSKRKAAVIKYPVGKQ